MRYTHEDLRHDVVHFLPTMFRNGLISENNFRNTHGIPSVWQNRMARIGSEVDEVFIQIASELLGRQFILYPVIPNEGAPDRLVISPSIVSNHEPYQILLYEDINFVTPHYQSVRPIQSVIESPENSEQDLPQNPPSMFSRLSAMSNQSAMNNRGNITRYIFSNSN